MANETDPGRLLTYDDYAALPEDGKRYQLIDGVLHQMTSPTFVHQELLARLFMALRLHADTNELGTVVTAPLDVVLTKHNVLQPDILFISNERRKVITHRNIQGTPDIAVEILSPSTSKLDLGRKRALYAEHGVRELLAVHTDSPQVDIFRLEKLGLFAQPDSYFGGDTLRSDILPDLDLAIDVLYGDLELFGVD